MTWILTMIKFKNLLTIFLATLLFGCGSVGPMEQIDGPVNTTSFEPIALATVKDGSKNVKYKEIGCLFKDDSYDGCGVFFITDNGVYLAEWNTYSYEYKLLFQLFRNQIVNVSESKYVREFGFDSNLLKIEDNRGNVVNFDLKGARAAKYELLER